MTIVNYWHGFGLHTQNRAQETILSLFLLASPRRSLSLSYLTILTGIIRGVCIKRRRWVTVLLGPFSAS